MSKPVGAALIAPVIETMQEPMAYPQVPITPVMHTSCTVLVAQASSSTPKPATLISQQTYSGGEGYDWSSHSDGPLNNSVNQDLMANTKGNDSFKKQQPWRSTNTWHIYSGCSRHMNGNNSLLINFQSLARRQAQKKISQKEMDKAQRIDWKNELVASEKFEMKDLAQIKMSTLSEMIQHVRKEQIVAQQSITHNLSNVPSSSPKEILKVKREIGEEVKVSLETK
ncbi:hypothetical protein L1987_06783 [Smallanthus sonchifolius]|uniref:Uncharacterized protein n=1 Tax=Smallanthus sonchifolius TaxID=185202 RepID=A0ACB9JZ94_9ASTR|nr:hypothetical protein L1987_06783 [Smallanthus sonchifolius]